MSVTQPQWIATETPERAEGQSLAVDTRMLGLWFFLATVTMLFAGFTSAILVRRTAPDWQALPLPSLLWVTTTVLFASSLSLERTRTLARQGQLGLAKIWLAGTVTLGTLFLAGQVAAWQQLRDLGVFLPTNPHSSFFYILTGVHGAHLLGGLTVLGWLLARPVRESSLKLGATYWHFLDGLWLFLFAMLFVV